jgi:Periplasmic protein involved in polysaccharide export
MLLLFPLVAFSAHAQDPDASSAARRSARSAVQAGDRIVVKVYRELELSDTLLVMADGTITLPRVGVVHAEMPIAALADTVRARYGKFLRNPSVELVVLRRVSVNGEVLKPDVYYVDVSMTLRDVIARAGGVTADGSDGRVDIVRRGQRIHIPNWQDDYTRASDLESGDQIVVGRRSWLSRNAFSAISSLGLIVSLFVTLRR